MSRSPRPSDPIRWSTSRFLPTRYSRTDLTGSGDVPSREGESLKRYAYLHSQHQRIADQAGPTGSEHSLYVRLNVERRGEVVHVVSFDDRLMGHRGHMARPLGLAQVAGKLPDQSEQANLIVGPVRKQSEIQQARIREILQRVHLRRRIGERQKCAQTLMGV